MSATTGQRARFHINRKRRIRQRMTLRALKLAIAGKGESTTAAPAEARKGPARRATE
jgi:hypothetical protein